MIKRDCTAYIKNLARQYPVITITGPRQSGKTTLAKMLFPKLPYISLENPDILEFALKDTRNFLAQYDKGAIFDEVQRCPGIFSYLQQIVDEDGANRKYVLTGSQQFGLRSGITQTLAGRAANCTLLPFGYSEWFNRPGQAASSLEEILFRGLYPPVYDRNLDPSTWYANYIQNYIERDVRQLVNIHELRTFQTFLKMCAARCGQLLNLSGLASDCGISVNTAKGWISVLEASYIIFLLQPHFSNLGKRLVKTPKLYFYDTGVLSYLLSLQSSQALAFHPMRGHIFESFVIAEQKKWVYNKGKIDALYFWRDHTGHEIDLLYEADNMTHAAEIKSGKTIGADFFDALLYWKEYAGKTAGILSLIYGGDSSQARSGMNVVPWRKASEFLAKV
jgi:predicted AAA+ superfamily ATPase